MKMVDLGFGAVAIEPDSSGQDNVGRLDANSMRSVGVSERAIAIYEQYGREGTAQSSAAKPTEGFRGPANVQAKSGQSHF